jgi:hypothetical protein
MLNAWHAAGRTGDRRLLADLMEMFEAVLKSKDMELWWRDFQTELERDANVKKKV